jgi:glycerophosphoryl diester phosphodiesterase
MKVVEQFIQSKTGDLTACEDGIFIGEHFAGVIDGATSTTKKRYDGKTTARVAKDILLKALENVPANCQAQEAVLQLDGAIAGWYKEHNLYQFMRDNPAERCFASAVIFSRKTSQIWLIGDCQALTDGKHITNRKFVDTLFADVRSFILECELAKGKTIGELIENDPGRAYIVPLIIQQTLFQNSDNSTFGFDCFDGFYNGSHRVKTVTLPDTGYVVLASDGYPLLYPTLSRSEEALQEILRDDPLCFRQNRQTRAFFPGFKSFDDRSYVKIQLG